MGTIPEDTGGLTGINIKKYECWESIIKSDRYRGSDGDSLSVDELLMATSFQSSAKGDTDPSLFLPVPQPENVIPNVATVNQLIKKEYGERNEESLRV